MPSPESTVNGGAAGPSRRGVLAGGALLGSLLPIGLASPAQAGGHGGAVLDSARPDAPYELALADNHILSSCLQCNTGCGIRAKVENGVITKIDGNPYSPWTMLPHLPYATAVDDAAPVDGSLCPKGQSGLQTAYDPYRLRKVLKRAGRRGENKWVSIPFDQAITEITEGGRLFADVPDEQDREVEGLQALTPLRDPDVAKAMATDVKAIWDEKDQTAKAALVAAFKQTHSAHLDLLIDPEHPDLGPKNNQVVVAWGRLKDGRGDLYKRFAAALGTTNAHGHTTVCQGSLYFTCKAISEQYIGGKFSEGKKFYWQADTENSRFILFVGANLFEANYGPPNRTVRLTDNLVTGRTRIAVADPRFSKLASKAAHWLPVKPGGDGALAMAFIRWMLDNERIDTSFLSCANKAAATARGETSWTNATVLVDVSDGTPGALVRAADIMVGGTPLRAAEPRTYPDAATGQDKEYEETFLVTMVDGVPTAIDPNDETTPVYGDLFVDATLPDGTAVKSGLQVLAESARERSVADWADLAGVTEKAIVAVAEELTSHGKAAAVDIHRGVAQHTNGFYNVLGWMTVNMLLGNFDAKGGMIAASTYDTKGKGKGELFDITAHPGKTSSFGVSSIRHGVDYEKTTLFADYPAKRNWYPLSSDIYEEIIPSIGDAYPYPVKALFLYMGAPTYALPAGHTNIEILSDVTKLPLFVANDILIGPTSMYADYIFPDLTFLERWEFQGSHPNIPNKVQPVRQPVIAPIPEQCTVYGQSYPISLEALLLGVAEKLDLPGFGTDAFGPGRHLRHPDELYLRQVANLAFGEASDGSKSVPDADDRELELFDAARSHLPASVYDPARWAAVVGADQWRKVVYVLNRGGRFEDHAKAYDGDRVTHPYGKLLNLYQEKTAKTVHAGTGEKHPGYATYIPVRDFVGAEPTAYRDGYDLALITHRVISQTKSRTVADPWLSALMPDNGILINPRDVTRLGLHDGQQVKVVSATNPRGLWDLGRGGTRAMIGKIVATQTMRPGVVSFALGFGHWATGASNVTIDGHTVKGEPRRKAGVHANAAMWTDPTVKNTCMLDPVGGSVSFYDTHIRLEPA
ncbi:molybdopterin-dependent oxidoreductase iron-sulfur protein [Micromonospora sp. Llam0]|uniref:molybdopterin-dependent oxidoreductase n=1 Tax=Micromonospora sp. Llam0 TaxID=2485143 RepID=UPI000F48F60A|nr:molybdopterin-dependent oxidoreductase [Micromonospora sp. Llam0]ROO52197.1 molybdopterin-dependent oxidoreductase iron-sulfur protein [Micromonospora sp. Llam0]